MPWDFAAGWLLVTEAGGCLTRTDGSPLDLEPGPVMGANAESLRAALQAVLDG